MLASCATVRTATASRVPKTATNTGSSSPPPNPATADSTAVANVAATMTTMTKTVFTTSHRLPLVRMVRAG
ncbi:hypothetical protein [Streptosporangium roseum]|uniref:hypothetical protein n=1 Tax=Streptosporangium roseum TaxID=2001 RepID=UPI003318CFEA